MMEVKNNLWEITVPTLMYDDVSGKMIWTMRTETIFFQGNQEELDNVFEDLTRIMNSFCGNDIRYYEEVNKYPPFGEIGLRYDI